MRPATLALAVLFTPLAAPGAPAGERSPAPPGWKPMTMLEGLGLARQGVPDDAWLGLVFADGVDGHGLVNVQEDGWLSYAFIRGDSTWQVSFGRDGGCECHRHDGGAPLRVGPIDESRLVDSPALAEAALPIFAARRPDAWRMRPRLYILIISRPGEREGPFALVEDHQGCEAGWRDGRPACRDVHFDAYTGEPFEPPDEWYRFPIGR